MAGPNENTFRTRTGDFPGYVCLASEPKPVLAFLYFSM
jgi:hypothetical protein